MKTRCLAEYIWALHPVLYVLEVYCMFTAIDGCCFKQNKHASAVSNCWNVFFILLIINIFLEALETSNEIIILIYIILI